MNETENNVPNKAIAYDNYIELAQAATAEGIPSNDVLQLLQTQGEMLGLTGEEMTLLNGLVREKDADQENVAKLYSGLLYEYKDALEFYEKKIIVTRLLELGLPLGLREQLDEEILGNPLEKQLYLDFRAANGNTGAKDYEQVFPGFCQTLEVNTNDYVVDISRRQELAERLNTCLQVRNVDFEPVTANDIESGPTVMRVKLKLAPGETISKINNCQQDVAREMMSNGNLTVDNLPGTNLVRIDVPRIDRSVVPFAQILHFDNYVKSDSPQELNICVGVSTSGQPVRVDLLKCHHLLVGGITGSGKSVFLKSLIMSLILKHSPDDLRLVIIDTKSLDFNIFSQLPHLDPPGQVITDLDVARRLITGLTDELDRRKDILKNSSALTLEQYNREAAPEEREPFVVVIIDEYADLVAQMPGDDRAEFEKNLCRIAQVSRALGIRIVLATQRPDATVVTGLLRANFPARIAFSVADWRNSNIIIDVPGAEHLLGRGDMLFSPDGRPPTRLQGLWMDETDALNAVSLCRPYFNPSASLFNKERLQASNPYDYTVFPHDKNVRLNLRPGEICFMEFNAYIYEQKTRTVRTNVGLGSFGKGMGMGVSTGESRSESYNALVDTAGIYLTNQRLVFLGENIGGEINYIDVIDFEIDDMTCKIYSGRQKNVFRFAFYRPNPNFFQNISLFFGGAPNINVISAGNAADPVSLHRSLLALIYLARSPGLDKMEWRIREEGTSCVARVKSHVDN